MPLSQWTLIGPEQHNKDTGEGATKVTKDTRDALLHLGKKEVRSPTDPPTEIPHHGEHASNVGKWAPSQETARGGRSKKGSTSSTTRITSRLASQLPLYFEIMWPR